MKEFALTALEKSINSYLQLDPETIKRISAYQGKVIKVEITDWSFHYFLLPGRNGFALKAEHSGKPDATLTGKSFDFLHVGLKRGNSQALLKSQLEIQGDNKLGEAMRDVLMQIDIDWEEHLSSIIGDSAAHTIHTNLKNIVDFGKQTLQTLSENLTEYAQHEAQHLPSRAEVNDFYQDVSTLNHDVERINKRIEKLLKSQKGK